VTRRCLHLLRTLGRWAVISSMLSALLFLAAGSTRIYSLRAYLLAFSIMLLITMLSVDPQLARERSDPGEVELVHHLAPVERGDERRLEERRREEREE